MIHIGSRAPGSQCPAGPLAQSGRGWRSCQGLDSSSTSNGLWGQQHKGGWPPRERRKQAVIREKAVSKAMNIKTLGTGPVIPRSTSAVELGYVEIMQQHVWTDLFLGGICKQFKRICCIHQFSCNLIFFLEYEQNKLAVQTCCVMTSQAAFNPNHLNSDLNDY